MSSPARARLRTWRPARSLRWRRGAIYVLDQHERHRLKAFSELRLVCVFTPGA